MKMKRIRMKKSIRMRSMEMKSIYELEIVLNEKQASDVFLMKLNGK